MNLCPYKSMDECARQYCDYWNEKEKICALALEIHERVLLLKKLNGLLESIEKEEALEATCKLNSIMAKMDKTKFN